MRIKLRLYTRDLDLLSAKQIMENEFGPAVRKALLEFVENGECSRIYVPQTSKAIILKNEQVDISLTRERYQPVVEWLQNLRPGVRNAAVKVIIRSAIANPAVFAFQNDSNIVIDTNTSQASEKDKGLQPRQIGAVTSGLATTSPRGTFDTTPPVSQINKPQIPIEPDISDDDDDFDLIGFDAFDNI